MKTNLKKLSTRQLQYLLSMNYSIIDQLIKYKNVSGFQKLVDKKAIQKENTRIWGELMKREK